MQSSGSILNRVGFEKIASQLMFRDGAGNSPGFFIVPSKIYLKKEASGLSLKQLHPSL